MNQAARKQESTPRQPSRCTACLRRRDVGVNSRYTSTETVESHLAVRLKHDVATQHIREWHG